MFDHLHQHEPISPVLVTKDLWRRRSPVSFDDIELLYKTREPIASLVLYDDKGAWLADNENIEIVVVAFSHGMPVGDPTEDSATLRDTIKAIEVVRAVNAYSLIVADLPKCLYPLNEGALDAALALVAAGADAVKLEGAAQIALVEKLCAFGVKVVGHIGYTPKTSMPMQRRGRSQQDLALLCDDALALQAAGVCCLVVEFVDHLAASHLTHQSKVPTLGIYSGPGTSGQVLVLNDVLDITTYDEKFFPRGKPKAAGHWHGDAARRIASFRDEVKARRFP